LLRVNSRANFRHFLLALRETLARPQEIRSVKWEELWWPGRGQDLQQALRAGVAVFVLHEYKARKRRADPNKPRVIPVSPRLGRLLVRLARGADKLQGPVFQNSVGRPWTNNAVRCRMRWLRKKMGLQRDPRGENIVAYTFRHTTATWAAAAGVRDRILAEILGHTSTRTTARYQHLEVQHLQDALESIRKFREKDKPARKLRLVS
jgi:integrase